MRAWSGLLFAAMLLVLGSHALAQLPVMRGTSSTRSGMLYYDFKSATDLRDRLYIYTIRPDSAACIDLDFNLVSFQQPTTGQPEPLVKVYAGTDTEAAPFAVLGLDGQSQLLQVPGGTLTFSFSRTAATASSTWTVMWQAKSRSACIDPKAEGPCADVRDICGPSYHENFPYYGVNAPQALESVPGTCVDRPHNATWYRFMAQKDGPLSFEIVPDNGLDDFDWVLLRGDAKNPAACPDLAQADRKLACNYAVGRGPRGSTGMDARGDACSAGVGESPYSQCVQARKGEVFYLLIDDFSKHSTGFDIRFNDVVMQCENPHKDLLEVDMLPTKAPPIDPRRSFSQYTRVLRIDLREKANLSLGEAPLPPDLFSGNVQASKPLGQLDPLQNQRGLAQALLQGLKTNTIPAWAAEDFRTPVHYGDLLEMMFRAQADSNGRGSKSWWNAGSELAHFGEAIELIVDEIFDKNTGQSRQEIRYVRLLWVDRVGPQPDYSVAVFRYADVRDLLDRVPLANAHNDIARLSLRDALESRQYDAITISRSSKNVKNRNDLRAEVERPVELESYHWQK